MNIQPCRVMTVVLASCSLASGGPAVFWLAGKQNREAEAFLFLLFAVVGLSRTLLLAFRHRPYRLSLAIALVLLAISGFLTVIARLTPEPVPVRTAAHTATIFGYEGVLLRMMNS